MSLCFTHGGVFPSCSSVHCCVGGAICEKNYSKDITPPIKVALLTFSPAGWHTVTVDLGLLPSSSLSHILQNILMCSLLGLWFAFVSYGQLLPELFKKIG